MNMMRLNALWVLSRLLLLSAGLLLLVGCRPASTISTTPTPTPWPTMTPRPTPTRIQPTATPVRDAQAFAQAERLGRGVNLGNALEAPAEGEWGMVLEEEFFPLIRAAGFDTIRVPIRWSTHAMTETPYTIDPEFFARVDWVIENGLANDLNVVINMHHYEEIFAQPDAHRERFIALWEQIVTRYRERPDSLYFEPLNEPHDALDSARWNSLMADTVAMARALDTRHTLILTGAEWGGIAGLRQMRIPGDGKNLIITFHYYDPYLFTHQGAEWSGPEVGTLGVIWPGPPKTPLEPVPEARALAWVATWFQQYNQASAERNPAGPAPIRASFDEVVAWAEKRGLPLWLGEFGAYSKADMQSRVNWTTFVREEAESRRIAWAYWEFGSGFGVYDREAQRWNEGLLRALIPSQ